MTDENSIRLSSLSFKHYIDLNVNNDGKTQ